MYISCTVNEKKHCWKSHTQEHFCESCIVYLSDFKAWPVNFYTFQTNIRQFSVRFEGKNVLNSFSNEIEKADSV